MRINGLSDCCETPGDANGDGIFNSGDVSLLIKYMYTNGPPPICMEEGDANGDGGINLADPRWIMNRIWGGGEPPICGNASVPGAGSFASDPGIPDTITVESRTIAPGTSEFAVDVMLFNDEELVGFDIPLIWDSPDIQVDSVSYIDSRVNTGRLRPFLRFDNALQQACTFDTDDFKEPFIQPGSGTIFTIWFSITSTSLSGSINIDSAFYPIADAFLLIMTDGFTISPQFNPGLIEPSCCDTPGDANGDGKVHLADASYLINYFYHNGTPPACLEEADANGDGGVNIADIRYIIRYLFYGGGPLQCGNSSVPGAGTFAPDPGIPDTITVEARTIAPGASEFAVDVKLFNDEELGGYDIPLIWDSPDIQVDSVSYADSRVNTWRLHPYLQSDNALQKLSVRDDGSFKDTLIYPGSGTIFTIWFSIDPEASLGSINIDSAFYPIVDAFFLVLIDGFTISPQFNPGLIEPSCCETPGDANSDSVCNLGDAWYIIHYLFYGGPELACAEEGDVNTDGEVNMGDASFIINYIFGDGAEPVCGR